MESSFITNHLKNKYFGQFMAEKSSLNAVEQVKNNPTDFLNAFGAKSYQDFEDNSKSFFQDAHTIAKASVILPTGMLGYSMFSAFPDLDISWLGIGYHRYWLFHSGLAAFTLKLFHDKARLRIDDTFGNTFPGRVAKKMTSAFVGGACMGLGVHLMADFLTPKTIQFPFIGSLVNGTIVDDEIWLLANSIYCFRIAHNVFALGIGDDLNELKGFMKREFSVLRNYTDLNNEDNGDVGQKKKSNSENIKKKEAKDYGGYEWGMDPVENDFEKIGACYEGR